MVKLILRLGAIVSVLIAVIGFYSTAIADASYITWQDADTIVISGGDLTGITFLKANGDRTNYTGIPILTAKKCSFNLNIYQVSLDHTTAMMMAGPNTSLQSAGSSSGIKSCTKNDVAYWNTSTGIANPQLATKQTATEDTVNKIISVSAYPVATPTNSKSVQDAPASDTLTLYFANSINETKIVAVNNTYGCQDFDSTCKGNIQYDANFTNKTFGTYRVCSKVAANCVTFEKKIQQTSQYPY